MPGLVPLLELTHQVFAQGPAGGDLLLELRISDRGHDVAGLRHLPDADSRAEDDIGGSDVIAEIELGPRTRLTVPIPGDRKSTRLNSSHVAISYDVFCLKKK